MIRWALALVMMLMLAGPALAENCTAQVTDFNFGTVSLRAGAVNQTTGSVTVDCRGGGLIGGLAQPVGVCLTFGGGSASDGGTPPRRYMTGPGGGLLEYHLRQTGNGGALSQMFVEVVMLAGRGTVTVPIYAEILSQSVQLPTGPYSATYPGGGASGVRMKTGVLACNIASQERTVDGFQVTAEAASSCEVTASALNFGNIGSSLPAHVDKTARIEVRCTQGTAYQVSLGLGNGGGVSDPQARKMRSLLSTLTYGLFQDNARSLPWGDTLATSPAGTGAGNTQIFTVFGRIFAGQSPQVGIYADNVVVTIHY